MVVDDVENDRQADSVTGVDQSLQPWWAAVGILHGKWIDAVVAPISVAGKLPDRHDFHGGDTEIFELLKIANDRVEGAFFGVHADMKLIDDDVMQRETVPAIVFPLEFGINDFGGAMHAFGLKTRRRIGTLDASIQAIDISASRARVFARAKVIDPVVLSYDQV